jgi:hypothetical protein
MAGALNALTNQVTWVYGRSKDTSAMIALMEILFNQHRSASKLYITWDAASRGLFTGIRRVLPFHEDLKNQLRNGTWAWCWSEGCAYRSAALRSG